MPYGGSNKPTLRLGGGAVLLSIAILVTAMVMRLDLAPHVSERPTVLVVSLDTGAVHFRNRLVRRFADELAELSGGELTLEIYESGQLMSDRDVPKALALGLIDFAVPADSKIARFDPNAALLSLPAFYGQPPDTVYAIADGDIGAMIHDSVSSALEVSVLTPVIDLGFTASFSTDAPLKEIEDYAGMKIRIPGGAGPTKLFESLGAIPVTVPFPDVPLALSQGNLDAIQTTYETARSAQLWDAGLRYCLEDNANLIQYYPMISRRSLARLSTKQQDVLRSAWRTATANARQESIEFQRRARKALADNGIDCSNLPSEIQAPLHTRLITNSRDLATDIGMDTTILEGALSQLAGSTP